MTIYFSAPSIPSQRVLHLRFFSLSFLFRRARSFRVFLTQKIIHRSCTPRCICAHREKRETPGLSATLVCWRVVFLHVPGNFVYCTSTAAAWGLITRSITFITASDGSSAECFFVRAISASSWQFVCLILVKKTTIVLQLQLNVAKIRSARWQIWSFDRFWIKFITVFQTPKHIFSYFILA